MFEERVKGRKSIEKFLFWQYEKVEKPSSNLHQCSATFFHIRHTKSIPRNPRHATTENIYKNNFCVKCS